MIPRSRLRSSAAGAAICAAVLVVLSQTAVASAATPLTPVTVVPADLGTVNYDGGADGWSTASATAGWDSAAPGVLFADHPTDGAKWTLDIEGKVAGTSTIGDDGLELTTVGYPSSDSTNWPISQKIRYSYFPGSGGYPAIDQRMTDGALSVGALFASTLSVTGTYAQNPATAATVYGPPTVEIRLQDPVTRQRVSIHSNGADAPQLGADVSTITLSDGDHPWWINSTAEGHNQYTTLSEVDLASDFADWDVVSFGLNLGRGADGTATIGNVIVLGQSFSFESPALPAPTEPPVEVSDGTPSLPGFDGDLAEGQGGELTLYVGAQFAGQWVGLSIHSTPQFLGYFLVDGTGVVTLTLPTSVPAGTHSVAVYDSAGVFQGFIPGVIVALAETGRSIVEVLPIALLFVLLGGILVVIAIRRRTTD